MSLAPQHQYISPKPGRLTSPFWVQYLVHVVPPSQGTPLHHRAALNEVHAAKTVTVAAWNNMTPATVLASALGLKRRLSLFIRFEVLFFRR